MESDHFNAIIRKGQISQLLANQIKPRRNKVELRVDQMLGISEGSSFMYSEKFKKRYNLKLYKIVGESGSVSDELIAKSS